MGFAPGRCVEETEHAHPVTLKRPGRVCTLILNGELYNAKELGRELKADTDRNEELFLLAYMQYGPEFVKKINGVFGAVIWDETKKILFLFRDRIGAKPMFYTQKKETLFFASAIGSLFQYPGVDPVLDENGLCEIFVLGPARTPGNGVFRDIYEVLPGHYLSFADGILKDHCYWNVKSQPHEDSREETVEKTAWLLEDSIKRQMESEETISTFLSGGVDSSLVTAVRAVGEGLGEKIFYLTAKTITRTVAEQAFSLLKEKGLLYKTITLTAKEKICFCEEAECNPDACPYAKGHFDRVNDAVFDLITHSGDWSREVLEEQAKKHMVCPFEMSLDVSNWADAVICDYNYAFDPQAHLKRFFSESGKGEYLFLIDEAHNLVERGREMYSASLYKEDLLEVRKLVKAEDPKLAKGLSECNQQFLELKRECEHYQILKSVSHIALKLMNVLSKLEDYLEECKDAEKKKRVLDFYFAVRSFLNIHDIMDENYVIFSEMMEDGRFQIKLFCVNPAVNLQNYLEQGNSTIFFSATLLPVHYYKKLLSVEKDDYAVYAHSSFPQENKFLFIGTDVSTRYTRRGESTYQRFARYIAVMAEQKKGNYMAFFPSYRFLEEVHTCFLECVDHEVDSICQVSYMDEEQREEFLEEFEQEREKSLVAFCVMGGIFSEGIDLTDDKLIGAVIAGTGLPQVCTEREILKQYFNAADMDGFDYAYLYPGMNKVLQSAGRVIRTESDRGVILLLDDRFRAMRYREVFPREWQQYQLGSVKNLEQEIRTFWESP